MDQTVLVELRNASEKKMTAIRKKRPARTGEFPRNGGSGSEGKEKRGWGHVRSPDKTIKTTNP